MIITPAMLQGETTGAGQHFYEALANELHPEGCRCRDGSCDYCQVYYGYAVEEIAEVAAIVEEEIREDAATNGQFGVGL